MKGSAVLNIVAAVILVCVLILICIWLFSSVYLEISYKKNEICANGEVWIKYLFLKKKIMPAKTKDKKEKEQKQKSESFETYRKKTADILHIFSMIKKDILDILRYCTKHMIVIKNLTFDFEYGLQDPMYTGILNGIFYGAAYNILSLVYHNANVEKFDINIKPNFDKVCHRLDTNCILRLKNVHITIIMVKTVKLYFKLKRKMKKERK